jgi:hypothetical protein
VSDDTKSCPVCAETIKAAAVKCRFCNTDFVAYEAERDLAVEKTLFTGHPSVIYSLWQWGVVALTLGIAYLVYWVKSRATHYRLTNQRIQIGRGLFSQLETSVELYRLDDFDIHKPFGMRMVGHAVLHLRSSDPDFRNVVVTGVPGVEKLSDQLRDYAMRDRVRRRVTTFVSA